MVGEGRSAIGAAVILLAPSGFPPPRGEGSAAWPQAWRSWVGGASVGGGESPPPAFQPRLPPAQVQPPSPRGGGNPD